MKLVKDLEGFEPEITSHLHPAFFDKERRKHLDTDEKQRIFCEGANYMREIIGSLPLPCEPLDREIIASALWQAKRGEHVVIEHEKVMLMEECYREADEICQRFGTSAVGTGKQGLDVKDIEKLRVYVEYNGGIHDKDCPEDDTCQCAYKDINDAINRLCKLSPSLGTKEVDEKEISIPKEVLEKGIESIIKYCADNELDISIPVPKGL